jgi:ketosteroid isomerase-like protein
MTRMTPRDLAVELVRCLNHRDPETALTLFDPDAELCFPGQAPRRVYRGIEGLREFFGWLVDALPVQTMAADRIHVGGSTAVVEFETTGTSNQGKGFDNVGALVIDTADGKIVSVRVYLDTADLARVLAVV